MSNIDKIELDVVLDRKELDIEDGGQFKAFQIIHNPETENGIYVKFCSWDENKEHKDFNNFINKRVKITIEVVKVCNTCNKTHDKMESYGDGFYICHPCLVELNYASVIETDFGDN